MPKDVADHPRLAALETYFKDTEQPLREGSDVMVSVWPFDDKLRLSLQGILHTGHVVQGLESIGELLDREKKGLDAARLKTGQLAPAPRLARLVFLSNDGSDRFLRDAAAVLARHVDRAHGVLVDVTAEELGKLFTQKGKPAKALLIDDRKALGIFLKTLADSLA
jgi:hypothetical protein